MIRSKEDYKLYLKHDTNANIKREKCSWIRLKLNVWYGNDSYRFLEYLYAIRQYEYYLNCKHGFIGNLLKYLAKIRYHRIGKKLNVNINPNTVGFGLRCPHLVVG